ncbi:hypothetical protein OG264_01785 [Streptomyces xanthophaeus]|uniref:hypothetical protein n=1 Tax=Streptomyces xanthophaeus TaxID=67385 RepID=UPI00233EF774|nr:hypothetical protein [Streptomyces xanthophaeus]WCD84052.1 hypothetical protein KPP03845_100372 [Streptomyces xanthophaeus]WST20331.1 hypothetical protein OG264_01785 [Streptomyces xanthophaeus]WST64683.1 hypothetical protein OG605_36575 [Streptomyces xanthophaeus]
MVLLLLMLLVPAGLVLTLVLVGHALAVLARDGLRRGAHAARLRTAAALFGAVAVALYTWGLLFVAGDVLEAEDGGTDSSPVRPCRLPGEPERMLHVVDYTVDWVPLRFVCETKGSGSYSAQSVPGYVNPAALGFALATAACGAAAGLRPGSASP